MTQLRLTSRRAATVAVAALLAACLAIPVPAARAEIAPPVRMQLLGAPRAAVAGEPLSGEIELVAGAEGDLADLVLAGDGWRIDNLELPTAGPVRSGERLVVAFTATPRDPERPLVLSGLWDGRPVRYPLDFSALHYRRVTAAGIRAARPAPDGEREDAGAATFPTPLWVRPVDKSAANITITVTGGWAYELPDTCNWPRVKVADMTVQVKADGNIVAQTRTNAYGMFNVSFGWNNAAGNPDVQVVFTAENDWVKATDYTSGAVRKWYSHVYPDTPAGTLDIGVQTSSDDFLQPVLHQFQTISRIHNWYAGMGYPLDKTTVRFPGDGEHFADDRITIPSMPGESFPDPAWNDGGYAHEYSHFWQSVYAPAPGLPYCNGICDASAEVCGHCYWCPEADLVVMVEGYAGVMGNFIPRELNITYGIPIVAVDDNEHIVQCWAAGHVGWDPLHTEGMYASLLYDMVDSNADQHGVFGAWWDRMQENASRVLTVTHLDNPTDPADFFTRYRARYPDVSARNFWETAMNCGMNFDHTAPGSAASLHSTSHVVGVPSADQTIDIAWTAATDALSGIQGYSIAVGHSLVAPDTTMEAGDVTSFHLPAQAPGLWYVMVRSVDRAGNWGLGYVWAGPFEIRAAEPADLGPYVSWGWSGPLVPRPAADAMGTSVPAPATLVGASNSTWWNLSGKNFGEATTAEGFTCEVLLDGVVLDTRSWGTILGGGSYMDVNKGPFTVRGGRHMLGMWHDSGEQVPETDETNNRWAHQWIWSPPAMTISALANRAAPPGAMEGWDDVVDGSAVAYNCDGLSFGSIGYTGGYYSWDAVYVYASNDSVDYDCRMTQHTTGPNNGFDGLAPHLGTSIRDAGCLDAVLFNGNTQGAITRDVGVLNRHEPYGTVNYKAMRMRAAELLPGNTLTTNLAAGAMMAFDRVPFAAADTGWATITVTVNPPTQAATLNWYLPTFTNGKLEDADLTFPINSGALKIERRVSEIGHHALAVYRDPRDGRDAWTVTVTVGPPEPDLAWYQRSGWYAPAVPRSADDGTSHTVAMPDTLYGNVPATWMNFVCRNIGHEDFRAHSPDSLVTECRVDGATVVHRGTMNLIVVNGTIPVNDHVARTVASGRHTVAVVADATDVAVELHEDNNAWAGQYCWSPVLLDFATPVVRLSPPDRTAGWDMVPEGYILHYNCDGLRLPASAVPTWRAVAVMPEAGGDVDVRLHSALRGAVNGFAGEYVASGWGPDASDFVLVDGYPPSGGSAVTVAFDAGVVRPDAATGYRAEAVSAVMLVPDSGGNAGPFTLGAGHLMHLYEIDLPAGDYRIDLTNVAGAVDWGLSLYAPPARFLAKSSAMTGGIAWQADRGGNEWISVTVVEAGRYALAVWKTDPRVTDEVGNYRLTFSNPVSAVPGDGAVPARSGLVAIRPNPFNPRTEVSYELSRSSTVTVAVYDLRGRRVRTLANGELPAGPHVAVWDGRSDRGEVVAGGVYLVRLQLDGESWTRKVSLLK